MRMLLFFLVLLFLLSSCSQKEKMPPDIFPVNKMKLLVWDLAMADQTASEQFLQRKDSMRMEATSLYQQVFAKHKTDKKNFYKSFTYYESHPELLKVLFDSVNSYSSRQKSALYKKNY